MKHDKLQTSSEEGLRERKKAAARAAILNAAEILFRTNGYTDTSMDAIARGAGVSRKTLFNYVSTKEGIVSELLHRFINDHMPEWLESEIPYFHDARDITAPHFEKRFAEVAKHRWLLTLAAEHTRYFSPDRSASPLSIALDTNMAVRARRIAVVQAEGKIRADVSAAQLSAFYESLRDLTLRRWLLTPEASAEDLQREFAQMVAVLQRGITPS